MKDATQGRLDQRDLFDFFVVSTAIKLAIFINIITENH